MSIFLRGCISCLGLMLLWQIIVLIWQLPNYILPTPGEVIMAFYQQHQLIAQESLTTLIETLLGLVFGVIFGCFAACALAFFKPLRLWFLPLLIISQAIPTFAIAPLLVMWLGFGLSAKIATTVLMIFFPITSAFYDGLQKTSRGWLELAQTMQASTWRTFWIIRIPAALPSFAAGLRIAAVIAPIGAIIGEWVGSSAGLGYLMLNANARMQIDVMFAALIVIIAMALILYFCVDRMLRVLVWW